jgi:hypothetical protein
MTATSLVRAMATTRPSELAITGVSRAQDQATYGACLNQGAVRQRADRKPNADASEPPARTFRHSLTSCPGKVSPRYIILRCQPVRNLQSKPSGARQSATTSEAVGQAQLAIPGRGWIHSRKPRSADYCADSLRPIHIPKAESVCCNASTRKPL